MFDNFLFKLYPSVTIYSDGHLKINKLFSQHLRELGEGHREYEQHMQNHLFIHIKPPYLKHTLVFHVVFHPLEVIFQNISEFLIQTDIDLISPVFTYVSVLGVINISVKLKLKLYIKLK